MADKNCKKNKLRKEENIWKHIANVTDRKNLVFPQKEGKFDEKIIREHWSNITRNTV